MRKIFKALKRKLVSFFKRKTLLDKVEDLEKRVAKLEAQNKKLMKKYSGPAKSSQANVPAKPAQRKDAKSGNKTERVLFLEEQVKKRRIEEKEGYISQVASAAGWERGYAAAQMAKARKEFGIPYSSYADHALYKLPYEQQKDKYAQIKAEEKEEEQRAFAEKKQAYITHIAEASGWDRDHAEYKLKEAVNNIGVSNEHYVIYKFWELTPEEQKTYFSKRDAVRLFEIYNKNPLILRVFRDKDMFCQNFEKFLGRPWMSTADIQFDEFREKFASADKIIYKPTSLSGGHGVKVLSFADSSIENVYKQLCQLPVGVVEGYLEQHPQMKMLSLNSVNTIRIVTVQTFDDIHGVEKGKVHFVYGGVRMGHGSSVVDNLHSGGMIACINMDTGVVETDAVDFANRAYERHPDTGVLIKGFQIPYFKEIRELIEQAGKDIPGYFGWDVAVTPTGPVLIEANTRPGADGLQTPFVPLKIGARHMIEKYLGE